MYHGVGVDLPSAEWPIWHRKPSSIQCNDTLISIKTTEGGSREELKAQCIYAMRNLKECLIHSEN